jgi:transcriptional regulator with XRE-family HTH domain
MTQRQRQTAERLRQARVAAGLTQEAVGQLFEPPISRAAVAQWERTDGNGTLPDRERLQVLALAYRVSIDFLLTGNEDTPIPPPTAVGRGVTIPTDAWEVAAAWAKLEEPRKSMFRAAITMGNTDQAEKLVPMLFALFMGRTPGGAVPLKDPAANNKKPPEKNRATKTTKVKTTS